MKYKGLLFDLDGTILDTTDLILDSFKYTVRVHYQKELDPNDVYPFFGKPLRDAMEFIGPEKVDELIKTYREYNIRHHDSMIKSFNGVAETLKILSDQEIAMAIVTSKTELTAVRGLKIFNLDKYFSVIIGCDHCERHKPDPEPVIRAVNKLGLSPSECLMVGDSPHDIESAHRAGVSTAAVRWTYVDWNSIMLSRPDFILEKMQDILTICDIELKS